MKRPPVSSAAQYGRPLELSLVEIISKQVRFSFGSTCTMRPPQRTRAPVLSSSAASRGVIWLNSPCSGWGTVLHAASSALARQAAANGRKSMLISPERGRKRRRSGTMPAQCPDQFVQLAPPLCTPGTVSVTPIGETRAERNQLRRAGAGVGHARRPVAGRFVRRAAQAEAGVTGAEPVPGAQQAVALAFGTRGEPQHPADRQRGHDAEQHDQRTLVEALDAQRLQ